MITALKANRQDVSELKAALLDDGDLENCYDTDEREIARFDGLIYSKERGQWLARFLPVKSSALAHSDGTYVEVLELARYFHDCRIKPGQCFLALTAFDTMIDREVAKLGPAISSPSRREP